MKWTGEKRCPGPEIVIINMNSTFPVGEVLSKYFISIVLFSALKKSMRYITTVILTLLLKMLRSREVK